MKTLNDMLDTTAKTFGGRTALATADESITFDELRKLVLNAAASLKHRGVRRGDSVAIVHRNSPDFVVVYFALSRLGAVAVPINFMVQKPAELAYMINDCGAVGILAQKEFLKGLRAAAEKSPKVKHLWITDGAPGDCRPAKWFKEETYADLLDLPADPVEPIDVREQDTATILYTSGTTGSPKGVMLTHRNLVTNCERILEKIPLSEKDVAINILPMFHSFAWTGNVLLTIRVGSKLVISPSVMPPTTWLKQMGKHGVTLFSAVPQVYSAIAKQAQGFKGLVLRFWFFRKVRLAISGAAPLAPAVQDEFEKKFGLPILEGFGLTETSPVATLVTPKERRRGSVGRSINGAAIKIIDDKENELPVDEEGEICIKGENVMKGYFNLPEATKEAFTTDGWFKTGDIGCVDKDGYLFIRDRLKDMIIIKGLKVFSAQVEATLLEHPDIEEAAVIGIPDEKTGDEMIKAFLVLKEGAETQKSALLKYCREKFDPYKRPRDLEIVKALPKNALQKVLKRELRQKELAKRSAQTSAK